MHKYTLLDLEIALKRLGHTTVGFLNYGTVFDFYFGTWDLSYYSDFKQAATDILEYLDRNSMNNGFIGNKLREVMDNRLAKKKEVVEQLEKAVDVEDKPTTTNKSDRDRREDIAAKILVGFAASGQLTFDSTRVQISMCSSAAVEAADALIRKLTEKEST